MTDIRDFSFLKKNFFLFVANKHGRPVKKLRPGIRYRKYVTEPSPIVPLRDRIDRRLPYCHYRDGPLA